MTILPVLSRLTFPEMVKSAIITRAAVSGARLTMTWKAPNEGFTREQKSASFLERCFMEPFGVAVQVLMLFLTQDAVGHALSKTDWLNRPDAKSLTQALPNAHERQVLVDAIAKHYKDTTPELLARVQYDAKGVAKQLDAVKTTVAGKLSHDTKALSRVNHAILEVLETGFHQKLKYATAAMLGLGVLSSAFFSGSLMQWMNDNVVAHRLIPWINGKLGFISQSAPRQMTESPTYIPTPTPAAGTLAMSTQGMASVPMSQYAPPATGLRVQA